VRCWGRAVARELRSRGARRPFPDWEAAFLEGNRFRGFESRLFRFMAGPDHATPADANRAAAGRVYRWQLLIAYRIPNFFKFSTGLARTALPPRTTIGRCRSSGCAAITLSRASPLKFLSATYCL